MPDFPIDAVKAPLFDALERGARRFAVAAPTGSGKSTRLPLMLAEKVEGRILVLQPRRVAARLLAKYVAQSAGSKPGDFAGWHIRLDRNFSARTKIVFLTEGVLARMLLADPSLSGVGAVVFDEFHERNIFSDVSLALALESARSRRPDLVLAVCSATIDTDSAMSLLGPGAVRLSCDSRLYPIDVEYSPPRGRDERVWDRAAAEFDRLARENPEGDFLVFMPGAYEISRTISAMRSTRSGRDFEILPLHGSLPAAAQDRAVAPCGRRRAVVATNIAETSLTIEGVRFVIDSGFARVARYDPARGVNTLFVERISHAAAVQRAGRAGRTAPGRAVRLWSRAEEADFDRFPTPEILRLDLSQTLLWMKCAGLDMASLPLSDSPSPASLARAGRTLRELGAVDESGAPTAMGRAMARFPAEPRYARMLLEAVKLGCLGRVSMMAAVAEAGRIRTEAAGEREAAALDDMLDRPASELEELAQICGVARSARFDEKFCRELGIHAANARRAFEIAADFRSVALSCSGGAGAAGAGAEDPADAAKAVLSAFSDRVCVRLNEGTLACDIAGGRRGEVRRSSKRYASKIFVALDLSEQSANGRAAIMASMLCPLERETIAEMFPGDFSSEERAAFDEKTRRVMSVRRVKFRDLVLEESYGDCRSKDEAAGILCSMIMDGRLPLKNWGEAEDSFVERVNFAAKFCPGCGIEPIDDEARRMIFEQMCHGASTYSEVKNAEVMPALRGWLSREGLAALDWLAPQSVELPRRKRPVKIRYELATGRAVVSSKFSDFFDFDGRKLKIAGGRVLPTYEILAPNGRPVQVTQNLEEFWKTSWPAVMKELKARYPKHFKNMG